MTGSLQLRAARKRRATTPGALVQNPALGAAALFRAAEGYAKDGGKPMPVLLAFLVLPMVFHTPTREAIAGTMPLSGLARFGAKFKDEEDARLAIHLRALVMRDLTFDALAIAVGTELLEVDYAAGTMAALPDAHLPAQGGSAKAILSAAARLAGWFSRLSPSDIADALRVEF